MYLVVAHNWPQDEAAVAATIAAALGLVLFEVRQKMVGGGPVVLASFGTVQQAESLAAGLSHQDIPTLVLDPAAVRNNLPSRRVRRVAFTEGALHVETLTGENVAIDYSAMALLLVATCSAGETPGSETVTERKFSLGKTLLAGGIPMTKKVTREIAVVAPPVRDEVLWLYGQGQTPMIFQREALNYDGLGAAMQLSRELNFAYLKSELRRRAPQAIYDDRLLKRPGVTRVLGPTLNPESDLDLACAILARCLRKTPVGSTE